MHIIATRGTALPRVSKICRAVSSGPERREEGHGKLQNDYSLVREEKTGGKKLQTVDLMQTAFQRDSGSVISRIIAAARLPTVVLAKGPMGRSEPIAVDRASSPCLPGGAA
jgi:hypothetical protein